MFSKRVLALTAALVLALSMAGCGASSAPAESNLPAADAALYNCGGLQAAIPAEYADLLVVSVPEQAEELAWGTTLLDVYEKASQNAFAADNGASESIIEGVGFLFGIARLDQAAYEQHLSNDYGGVKPFGKDDDGNYYAMTTPTDVQIYRSGEMPSPESEDWKNWEILNALGGDVCADFVARNHLTAYTDTQFTDRAFTYDGDHAYAKYFTYHDFDGDDRLWDTLVLSQPATQGTGGIWCVERFYDCRGTLYYAFPDAGVPAADYYAKLQAQCDSGETPELLTPLGAAEDFAKNSIWYSRENLTAESFEQIDAPDTAYFTTNTDIEGFIGDFQFAQPYDQTAFLACLASFTSDTWGVLGRNEYGSDWWTPLKEGIAAVAVGSDQETRDAAIQHLYLTAPGEPYAADLAAIIQTQYAADTDAFDAAASSLSSAEQSSIQSALK